MSQRGLADQSYQYERANEVWRIIRRSTNEQKRAGRSFGAVRTSQRGLADHS